MKSLHCKFVFTFISIIIVCSVNSCKKDKTRQYSTLDFEITYTGDLAVGSYVSFSSTLAQTPGITYLWSFGDGIRSTDSMPTHAYANGGEYSVTLTVNNDTASRKSKIIVINPDYSFDIAGLLITGKPISFILKYSQTLGSTYLWDFGDGITSTDSMPIHVFANGGAYNVTLTVNSDIVNSSGKAVIIIKDPVYTYLIHGLHSWHGTKKIMSFSTSTNGFDTTFAINYVNPIAIAIEKDTLQYIAALSDSNILYFRNTGSFYYNAVTFNHTNNSIHIQHNFSHNIAGIKSPIISYLYSLNSP